MNNVWKTLAIIFISLFILETSYIIYAFNAGAEMIHKDNECGINICKGYDSYWYDIYDEMCYCFKEGEGSYKEYIGGD